MHNFLSPTIEFFYELPSFPKKLTNPRQLPGRGNKHACNRPCHGFNVILTSRQTREKLLQCLYENLKSNNCRKMAVLKKI